MEKYKKIEQINKDLENERLAILNLMEDALSDKEKIEISNRHLEESVNNYRGLFDTIQQAIYIQEPNGCFIDVNQGAVEMYGYEREYFKGKTPEILSAPGKNDLSKIMDYCALAYAGFPQKYEFWGIDSGSRVFPKDVWTAKGTYYGKEILITLASDITDRKHSEALLAEKTHKIEEQYEEYMQLNEVLRATNYFLTESQALATENAGKFMAISNQTTEGITLADVSGRYLFVNPAFCAMSGYSEAELLSMNVADMKYETEEYLHYYEGDEEELGKATHVSLAKKDGTEYIADFMGKVIVLNGIEYLLGTVRDVTDRINRQKELIKAKERAEESDRLKTAFLQNMSHEIRTPLNGIIGFSGLLQKGNISPEDIKEYVEIIKISGNRLIEIVNNVLDISRIETGQLEIVIETFQVSSVMLEIRDFFDTLAKNKGIELIYEEKDGLKDLELSTDESKMMQVMINLVNNAIKFTSEGVVSYGYELKDGEILFHVRDTGIGIALEMQEKVFERFVQAELSITRGYEGAGLGLAICKGLLELMGGRIWIDSEVNKGTTFYFTLPAHGIK